MNDKMFSDEFIQLDETKENIQETTKKEIIKTQSRNKNKSQYKEKECKIINYDKHNNYLDISFDGYGVRISNIENFNCNDKNTVIVKYNGNIGKSNFSCRL